MPTISNFYGISIQMYFFDHAPPHFHARYGHARALFRITDAEIIAGELPAAATRMVKEWALAHRTDLEENWRRAVAGQPLEKVAGPDDKG